MSNRRSRFLFGTCSPKECLSRSESKDTQVDGLCHVKEILLNLRRKNKTAKNDNLSQYAEVLRAVVDAVSRFSTCSDNYSDTSTTVPETVGTHDSVLGCGGASPSQRRNATGREVAPNPFYASRWPSYANVSDDYEFEFNRLLDQTENDRFRLDHDILPESSEDEYIVEEPIDEVDISLRLMGYEEGFSPEVTRGGCETIEEISECSVSSTRDRRTLRRKPCVLKKCDEKCACGMAMKPGRKCSCGLVWV